MKIAQRKDILISDFIVVHFVFDIKVNAYIYIEVQILVLNVTTFNIVRKKIDSKPFKALS